MLQGAILLISPSSNLVLLYKRPLENPAVKVRGLMAIRHMLTCPSSGKKMCLDSLSLVFLQYSTSNSGLSISKRKFMQVIRKKSRDMKVFTNFKHFLAAVERNLPAFCSVIILQESTGILSLCAPNEKNHSCHWMLSLLII